MIPNRYFARFSRHPNPRYFGLMRILKLCLRGVEGGELLPPPSRTLHRGENKRLYTVISRSLNFRVVTFMKKDAKTETSEAIK